MKATNLHMNLKKPRDAGKDEFEVDGKKYSFKERIPETDEEVVAEAINGHHNLLTPLKNLV